MVGFTVPPRPGPRRHQLSVEPDVPAGFRFFNTHARTGTTPQPSVLTLSADPWGPFDPHSRGEVGITPRPRPHPLTVELEKECEVSPPLSRETFTPKVSRTAPRTVHSGIRSARNAHTPLRATTYGYHPRRIHSLHSEQELEHLKVRAWTGLSVRRWRCLRFRCSGIL